MRQSMSAIEEVRQMSSMTRWYIVSANAGAYISLPRKFLCLIFSFRFWHTKWIQLAVRAMWRKSYNHSHCSECQNKRKNLLRSEWKIDIDIERLKRMVAFGYFSFVERMWAKLNVNTPRNPIIENKCMQIRSIKCAFLLCNWYRLQRRQI